MIPTRNTSHVSEAKARFTSMFANRKVMNGIITSMVNRLQILENTIWDVINQRNLNTNNDYCLDIMGGLVGEPRNGRANAEYHVAIGLRILINRSQGKRSQLLKIIGIAANGGYSKYWDAYPAGFRVFFLGTAASFLALATALREAKAAGIGGGALYSSLPITSLMIPSSVYGTIQMPFVARGPSSSIDGLPLAASVHVVSISY